MKFINNKIYHTNCQAMNLPYNKYTNNKIYHTNFLAIILPYKEFTRQWIYHPMNLQTMNLQTMKFTNNKIYVTNCQAMNLPYNKFINHKIYNTVNLEKINLLHNEFVIYWPSTEPLIKRCTCVNKRKNSGNRWALDNNITRCPDGSRQLETGCQHENQLADRGLCGPQWPTVEQPKPRWERSAAMVGEELGVNIAVHLCLHSFLSHESITLSRIKCERYIFIKKCFHLFIEVIHYRLMMFSYVSKCTRVVVLWLYNKFTVNNLLYFPRILAYTDCNLDRYVRIIPHKKGVLSSTQINYLY